MFHNQNLNLYSQRSVPLGFRYSGDYDEPPEEASSSSLSQRSSNSDEEVVLASSCPKKRAGRKKFKETRHPVYRGVRQRNGNKWVCEVRAPNDKSRIWLGTYPTAEMAARAHDVAALALRGRPACLNFADSASILPLPASMGTSEIQTKAAEVAELFRPAESSEECVQKVTYEAAVHPEEMLNPENNPDTENNVSRDSLYMDEEAMFGMPMLLTNMAEGLLLPPPRNMYPGGFSSYEIDSECEVSLWSY